MLTLSVLSAQFAVVRLEPHAEIPAWAIKGGEFFSVTKTHDELSVVCQEDKVPHGSQAERGWRSLKVHGPLDFGLTGILYSLSKPLAEAKISIFAISTFDTDYILVKQEKLQEVMKILGGFCKILHSSR
jgi:hypothetical protein